ncbi:sulfopyruvate decarboxylase subunit alpha [Streptomyces sp. NA02950]|uniref:thiamine pyrophosphate-binding protein n=1 Tax=Streptomyces sp. NA02950 TaxID=2742137 RepID=UPI001591461F|nr:thiamine pyrophosphate-binding protein [Streptomyces sp. NA02950]QKV93102.1 sulfopyruvate decarboxylase subunit alpha [Streptomyces sp. NA02950]
MLSAYLADKGFGPFFGTPCGILAPLYQRVEDEFGLRTVPREDNAVGVAAGAAMAGQSPVVMMQNSGLGQSVNALASLVVPYEIPLLLIVSLRGILPDTTPENTVMGRLTEPLLSDLGIPAERLQADMLTAQVDRAHEIIHEQRRPAALLVPPSLFGWQA